MIIMYGLREREDWISMKKVWLPGCMRMYVSSRFGTATKLDVVVTWHIFGCGMNE